MDDAPYVLDIFYNALKVVNKVILTGDFDQWEGKQEMQVWKASKENTVYILRIPMINPQKPEKFLFKFIVDGQWYCSNSYPIESSQGYENNVIFYGPGKHALPLRLASEAPSWSPYPPLVTSRPFKDSFLDKSFSFSTSHSSSSKKSSTLEFKKPSLPFLSEPPPKECLSNSSKFMDTHFLTSKSNQPVFLLNQLEEATRLSAFPTVSNLEGQDKQKVKEEKEKEKVNVSVKVKEGEDVDEDEDELEEWDEEEKEPPYYPLHSDSDEEDFEKTSSSSSSSYLKEMNYPPSYHVNYHYDPEPLYLMHTIGLHPIDQFNDPTIPLLLSNMTLSHDCFSATSSYSSSGSTTTTTNFIAPDSTPSTATTTTTTAFPVLASTKVTPTSPSKTITSTPTTTASIVDPPCGRTMASIPPKFVRLKSAFTHLVSNMTSFFRSKPNTKITHVSNLSSSSTEHA